MLIYLECDIHISGYYNYFGNSYNGYGSNGYNYYGYNNGYYNNYYSQQPPDLLSSLFRSCNRRRLGPSWDCLD